MTDFQGFIFVSSANGVTPFHIDYEENFFVHIHGEKFMHVFDNRDRTLVSEADLETFPGKHRNHHYEESFERKGTVHQFAPGDGLFLPYTWPHWVRTGSEWTISKAITWKSPLDLRMNRLYFANAVMRKLGLPQPAPGRYPALDGLKVAAFAAAQAVVAAAQAERGHAAAAAGAPVRAEGELLLSRGAGVAVGHCLFTGLGRGRSRAKKGRKPVSTLGE